MLLRGWGVHTGLMGMWMDRLVDEQVVREMKC